MEHSNADLEMKIKKLMIDRIPKGHDLDSMMAQAHTVELEVSDVRRGAHALRSQLLHGDMPLEDVCLRRQSIIQMACNLW